MFKHSLFIAVIALSSLNASEDEQKEIAPGLFVCNQEESICTKDEDSEKEDAPLSLFCPHPDDELEFFACKDCKR